VFCLCRGASWRGSSSHFCSSPSTLASSPRPCPTYTAMLMHPPAMSLSFERRLLFFSNLPLPTPSI